MPLGQAQRKPSAAEVDSRHRWLQGWLSQGFETWVVGLAVEVSFGPDTDGVVEGGGGAADDDDVGVWDVDGVVQPSSSLPSIQSLSPSQRQYSGRQTPSDLHVNCPKGHLGCCVVGVEVVSLGLGVEGAVGGVEAVAEDEVGVVSQDSSSLPSKQSS